MPRPTDFSAELGDRICALLAEEPNLRKACREHPDLPNRSTINRWLASSDEALSAFRAQYALARTTGLEGMAEDCLDIADDGSEEVARSRLRFDARRWLLSKLLPKQYGDKLELAGDKDNPLVIEKIERVIVDPKPADGESI